MSYKHVVLADLKETFEWMIGDLGVKIKCIPNYITYTQGFFHGMSYHFSNSHIVRDLLQEDKRNIVQEVTNILSYSSDFVVEDYEKEHNADGKMRINQIISLKISCFLLQQDVRELFEKMDGYHHPDGKTECIPNHITYTCGFLHGIEYHQRLPWIFVNLSDEDKSTILRDIVKMKSEAFYFSFGASEDFPFQNGYIIIYASDISSAYLEFKRLYPNEKDPDVLNCSEVYFQEEWEKLQMFKGQKPFNEIILLESDSIMAAGYNNEKVV